MALDITKASTHQIIRELASKLFGLVGFTPIKVQVSDAEGQAVTPLAATTFTGGGQKTQVVGSDGAERTGVCGGNVAVAASENAFDYPSWIENTGATDGTISYTDEYGNIVAGYPLKSGTVTGFRVNKVTATTCTGLYRSYSR